MLGDAKYDQKWTQSSPGIGATALRLTKKAAGQTRSGAPYKAAPVTWRRRCRMHGGADGSGAPRGGSKNGNYKHGRYTREVVATRRWLRDAIHTLHELKKRP